MNNVCISKYCVNQKLPSLDGWRAFSVSLVLLDHCKYAPGFPVRLLPITQTLSIGGLGVRFFFVISGFLITWLLIQEHEKTGKISLRKFYIRRSLRIFPVCFAYLAVLAFFTSYQQSTSAWIANLTYTTDFLGSPLTTFHLWSLGVEEQFYLIWPLLLVLRVCGPKAAMRILAIPLMVAPIVRLLYCKGWFPENLGCFFQNYSFFSKFDSLAFGCIAAILFFNQRNRVELLFQENARLASWGGVALLALPLPLQLLHFPARLQAATFDSLQACGFTILLLQSVLQPGRGCFRVLNWNWVKHLGVLSYSIYIWQQMFCGTAQTVFGVKEAWWVNFPAWIFVTLVAAHVSYFMLEKPFFRLRENFRA